MFHFRPYLTDCTANSKSTQLLVRLLYPFNLQTYKSNGANGLKGKHRLHTISAWAFQNLNTRYSPVPDSKGEGVLVRGVGILEEKVYG